jgi:tetratricopeptide (TPR) repeat protein
MSGAAVLSPAEVEAAARQLATAPAEAEHQARRLLARAPGDPRLQLVLASARRRQGAPREALGVLLPLARAFPRAANTQYELGATLVALGEADAGLQALRRAVALNRDQAEAWRAIGDVLFRRGEAAGAEAAYLAHARAQLADPGLKAACDALAREDAGGAEGLVRAVLEKGAGGAAALRLLGEALDRQGRYAEAEVALRAALSLDAGFDGAWFTLASVLFHQQKAAEAAAILRRLLAREPDDPPLRNLLAGCLGLVGDMDEALALYRDLLDDYPGQPQVWLNYGHALRTVGRAAEAVDAYRRCIAFAPAMGEAYWGLANLKVARFSEAEVEAMRAALARELRPQDRLHLAYALGKAEEDRGRDAQAFARYAEGAAVRRRLTPYDPDRLSAAIRRLCDTQDAAFFEARTGAGSTVPDPIFVVGLPRSGSTLVEQILASHSAVEGTMELPDVGLIAHDLVASAPAGSGAAEAIAHAPKEAFADLARRYLDGARAHRRLGRPFFVDKMPNNFQHVGLIHLMLPRARIIDVRRHPLGAGFSCFKQHFAQGQDFSYGLEDIGRYYCDYLRLSAHFDAVLPGRVHRVIYEDLVEDTEAQVRRLLAACGLPFEEGCLRFYETRRAVKTVSSEQVRRPIFRDGLDQWRRFEPWLDPLKAALGPALEDWRGAQA